MRKDSKVLIDTNVVIRANIRSAPFHEQALAALERLNQEGSELWISRQILREYIVNVTRPQPYAPPLSMEIVQEQIKAFEGIFQIADNTAQVTAQLMTLLKEIPVGGKKVHDANIVATMLAYGVDMLLTYDIDDMKRFKGKVTLMPLEEVAR